MEKYRKETYKDGKLIDVFDNRDLAEEKLKRIKMVKQYTYEILKESDWEIIKAKELKKNVDKDLLDRRREVRLKCNEIEKKIEDSESLAELDVVPWDKDLIRLNFCHK